MEYPKTHKMDQIDDYHGTKVADPYRWLEDDDSEETKEWLKKQESLTNSFFEKMTGREKVRKLIEKFNNFPKYEFNGSLMENGETLYFYTKNCGTEDANPIFFQKGLDGTEKLLIDQGKLKLDCFSNIFIHDFSADGKYILIGVSKHGKDWLETRVLKRKTKELLPDVVSRTKFGLSQFWDDGFFYPRFEEQKPGEGTFAQSKFIGLFYHKLGTNQSEDKIVFDNGTVRKNKHQKETPSPILRINPRVIDDRYLLLLVQYQNSATYYLKDLQAKEDEYEIIISSNKPGHDYFISKYNGNLLFAIKKDAPNGKIVSIELSNLDPKFWKVVVPEKEHMFSQAILACGKLFLNYVVDVKSVVHQYSANGVFEKVVSLPALGKVELEIDDNPAAEYAFMTFESFTTPKSLYAIDTKLGIARPLKALSNVIDPTKYNVKQVFYGSKDGTKVPMFIVGKRGPIKNGERPTLLNGYGGFGKSMIPFYSSYILAMAEFGGIFALANIRGGGEYGEKWHEDGCRNNKQNGIDDFISAAEFLIAENYTNTERLTIFGGSNGGILVGAAMCQRPELFKAVLASNGLYDMLRFDKFSVGATFSREYGLPSNPEDFNALYSISPVHSVKAGKCYPATLILTMEHDDRVPPIHSYKFAATLQANQSCENQILLRVFKDGGHQSMSEKQKVDYISDMVSFALWQMGCL